MKKNTARVKVIGALVVFAAMLMVCIAPTEALRMDSFVTRMFTSGSHTSAGAFNKADSTQPDKWYVGSEFTIDEHFIFGEDRMYTEGKANRGFENLIDNNSSTVFYVTTNDTGVNYQNLTGKEISITFHTNSPVVINHFKIVSGFDTYKANYAHRQPTAWNLKAGNSLDSCDNVLLENLPVNATVAYEENIYEIENTTAYKYYKFTITALAGAGRSGHDSPFSNPTATCTLTDIAIGGPEPGAHASHDGITFEKWNSTNSLPNTAGDYYLTEDVTIGSTWNVPSGTTNLCLNGHSITKTGNTGSAFYSGSGSTLNLYDCDTTTHYYDINGSTYLAENINTTSGTYSFVGGYITGGVGRSVNGGYRGGGVYVQGGTLNIYGGALVGNKASNGEGGGVMIDYGTVTMTGGYIVGNYASTDGGGLQVTRNDSGFFYMTGGHIDNNTANSHGGGITTYNVAEISGGTINGNQCFGGNRNYYKEGGGGIQTEAQGKLTVCGNVEISGNRSAMSGGGILVWGDCNYFKLSGSPVIKDNTASYGGSSYSSDNIRLNSNKKINIDGSLSNTAPIGVSLSSSSNNSTTTGEFTSGWKTYMGNADPAKYFTSDSSSYDVFLISSGEATIGIKPVATVTNGSSVNNYSSFSEALSNWSTGSTLKLESDVEVSSTVTVPSGEHTLDLNGHGILMTGNARVITINQNASLELNDSNPDKIHYITLTNYRATAVSDTGEASVSDGNGVIKVTGGYLAGGYLNNSGSHDKCGAGVFNWGTFTMNAGSIVGNFMQNNSGAGVRNSGTFTMNDGTIAFNKATGNGGGVTTYVPGGGQGKMTMNGGEISDNYCGSYGGGIQLAGPFELTGGSVIRNTAGAGGSGIYYGGQGEKFKLSGDPIVKDNINNNLYLNADATFMINGSLSEDAEIGITMNKNAVFTVGWNDYMTGKEPDDYFVSDNDNYVVLPSGNEVMLSLPPVASITSGENTIYYSSISDALEGWKNGGTLTLLKDASYSSVINIRPMYGYNAGEYTLDLNGKTLNVQAIQVGLNNSPNTLRTGPHLTIEDSETGGILRFSESGMIDYGGLIVLRGGTLTGGNGTWGGLFLLHIYASLDMYDGVTLTGNTSTYGGAVLVGSDSEFNMYGGKISGNSASDSGGGVVIFDNDAARFNMYGGEISGNRAPKGGGVSVNVGSFHICGNNAIIKDNIKGGSWNSETATYTGGTPNNVYLPNGKKVIIESELSSVPIGVTLQNGSGVFTTGWNDNMSGKKPEDYFFSDNDDYIVAAEGDEAAIIYPVLSGVSAEGYEGSYDGNAHSITVSAPEGTTVKYGTQEGDYSLDSCPTFTDAGTYTVYYQVSKEKYLPATGSATVKIDPISATVTVTGHSVTVDYDGKAHSADGFDAVADNDLYDVTKDFTLSTRAEAKGTNAGTTVMGLSADQFTNTNTNFATVNFIVTDGYLTINPINAKVTIVGNNSTVDYDGKEHKVEGYVATADTDLYDVTKDFAFSGNATAVRTDAGVTAMGLEAEQFENINGNFATVTFELTDGYQKIEKINATVTIVGNNNTADYDGREHEVTGYVATADTDLYDVTKDFTFNGDATALRTDAGITNMGLKVDQFENVNENFTTVSFIVTDGYQKITPIDVTVTIVGNNAAFDYDGKEHTVTGFVATADKDVYDVTKDFTFSGNDTVSRTEAGITNMELNADQFENTNDNFATVAFEVSDGYIQINKINVTVTIVGNNATFDYDGKEHTVTGFVATADTDVYDVTKDFIFTGDSTISRTDVGTVYMGLFENKFANTNDNFDTVTFVITDGYLTINPINATVTVVGNNSTVDYDGKDHKVTGYVATADTDLYDVTKDFTFSGDATAAGNQAGTINMGLKAAQFTNTNENFATVTFVVTDGYLTIKPINATVTIVGNNATDDYDGKEHKVEGYVAKSDTELYDVTKDFTFSGNATALRTEVGTTNMGLKAEQFVNKNNNFATVTFNVTDGYQSINQINATVTIVGNKDTADYDGKEHKVTGYVATSNTDLFDVTKDFTFSGDATAVRTEVGTTNMGLKAEQFANQNNNFANVTFNVTDGYLKINTVSAVILSKPAAKELTYNGSAQQLIIAGEAEGGTMYYALGADSQNAPADSSFDVVVPSAKEAGIYYVWYKVVGDSNHEDLAPACLKSVIAEEEWVGLSGTVYGSDGKTPLEGVVVSLNQGNKKIDYMTTQSDGKYHFTVPAGVYNLVAQYQQSSETVMVTVNDATKQDIVMSGSNTGSILKVNAEGDKDFGVAVGGLNDEAQSIREKENIPDNKNVSVVMTVELKTDETAKNASSFNSLSQNKSFMFFDVTVEKTVGSDTTAMSTTTNVIEIAVPYEKINRHDLAVYYSDGTGVRALKESSGKEEGTFFIDKENGYIYIYTNRFSTFAIGYTPHYKLSNTVELGSFKGKANVFLIGQNGEGIFKLENASISKIGFADIPKGKYIMTLTWSDGATNTLTVPITVSK